MNGERRKRIAKVITLLEAIDLSEITSALEALRDEEQEAFDNMPESFQDGDRGQAAQEAIDHLESAISAVEGAEAEIDWAVGELNDATG